MTILSDISCDQKSLNKKRFKKRAAKAKGLRKQLKAARRSLSHLVGEAMKVVKEAGKAEED